MIVSRWSVHRWFAVWLGMFACRDSPPTPEATPPLARTERSAAGVSAPVSLDVELARADSLYFRGEYDGARTIWASALVRAQGASDSLREARILTWLGLVAWRTGDYAVARRLGDSALALKQRWNLTRELGSSYNALGLLAWNEGRLSDALDLFNRTMQAAHAAGDRGLEARAVGNLALVHT